MKVRTVRDEIIDLDSIKIFTLEGEILIIKDDDKIKKYTLTEESKQKLKKLLEEVR